jgi:hypothetical protein
MRASHVELSLQAGVGRGQRQQGHTWRWQRQPQQIGRTSFKERARACTAITPRQLPCYVLDGWLT